MKVFVNNFERDIQISATIQELLYHLNINTGGVAIAVNEEVIARDDWQNYSLKNDDRVLVIRAAQGG